MSASPSWRHTVSGILLVMLCLSPISLISPVARAEVVVLTSIKPLALIAEAVVGEQGRVSHLLPANASPHDYPLRVSDMQRLSGASLVLWVGPDLETFLRRPLANVPAERTMAVGELSGLNWPSEDEASIHTVGEHDHAHHHHEGRDPHLWLNPANAGVIARALAERLAVVAPEHAEQYQRQAMEWQSRWHELDSELNKRLSPVRSRKFAVYHEGYRHFVAHYGLSQVAAVTLSPERRPGARHLYELRETLRDARCLFTEPYYDMSAARDLADEMGLSLGEMDLLGASEAITSYQALLVGLTDAVVECLSS